VLRTEDLTIGYEQAIVEESAIPGLSAASAGQFLGANGSGKTTLLRTLTW